LGERGEEVTSEETSKRNNDIEDLCIMFVCQFVVINNHYFIVGGMHPLVVAAAAGQGGVVEQWQMCAVEN
jgi:hypothetical protein